MRNINDFIAVINKKVGLACSNRYLVEIQQSELMRKNYGMFAKLGLNIKDLLTDLQFLCTACQLPGRELATTECRLYGSTVKYPYVEIYDDLTLTFLCTNKAFEERKFFDAWIQSVIPVHTHDMNFMTEYSATIDIYQLDGKNEKIYGLRILSAFPIAIIAQEMASDGEPIEYITVTMSYDHWENLNNEGYIIRGYDQSNEPRYYLPNTPYTPLITPENYTNDTYPYAPLIVPVNND